MEVTEKKVDRDRSRSPEYKRSNRPRDRGRRARSRSGSPGFNKDGISNNTQREEYHLKRGRLFVGNVEPTLITRQDLVDIFSKHGDVLAVSIHPGYAFVQMDSYKSANRAVNLENGRIVNGNKINVEFSSAALKAGARMKRLSSSHRSRSPPPSREYPPPPIVPDPFLERETRLSRILALERELKQEMSYLHDTRDDLELYSPPAPSRRPPPSDLVSYPSSSYYDSYAPHSSRDHGGYPSRRDDIYSRGQRSDPYESSRPLSPRARPNQDYNSRQLSERLGNRYGMSSSYPYTHESYSWDTNRGPYQQGWQ